MGLKRRQTVNRIKALAMLAIAFGMAGAYKIFWEKEEEVIPFTPDINEEQD